MDLSKYDQKYIRLTDTDGNTFTGIAVHGGREFLAHEYGGDEDGLFIEDVLVYRSQIASVEEITPHGTVELWTDRLVLRRCRPDDAEDLHRCLGTEAAPSSFPEPNRFSTPESARETVRRAIGRYGEERFYWWVIDAEDIVIGTIGACDRGDDRLEIGFALAPAWRGRGCAEEALKKVLRYLTENEGIPLVTARRAAEDIETGRVLEEAGMKPADTEDSGPAADDQADDFLIYEYRKR